MAISIFVPEFWSTRLLRHLDSKLVYAQPTCVNRDYEGEISQAGDTVHINKVGAVTAKSYTKATDMASPERPDGTQKSLVITEQWYWNIAIDDINKVQANVPLLDAFAERAAQSMSVKMDEVVAATMIADAGITIGSTGTPATLGNGLSDDYTLFELAVEQRRLLDNNDAPPEGRWMVIPPDLESTALLDPNFVPAGAGEQRTGIIGSIAGFDVLKSTAVPIQTGTGSNNAHFAWGVVFGAGNYATTHANQIVETKAYEIEAQFGDGLKGLNVWGTEVIEPTSLGVASIYKA